METKFLKMGQKLILIDIKVEKINEIVWTDGLV